METFNFKSITSIINIILLVTMLGFSFCQKQKIDSLLGSINLFNSSSKLERIQMELNQKDSIFSIIREQDKIAYNILLREYHTETIARNNQIEEFKKLQLTLSKYGIKLDNLNSNLQLTVKKVDSTLVSLIPVQTDTSSIVTNYNFNDSISHLKISGNIDVSKNIIKFQYRYNASYNILTYKEKQGFFKAPLLKATIESDDPNAELSFKTIFIKNPKPKVQIGLGLGQSLYYKNGVKFAPSIQIGVYIPVLSIY